MIFSRHSRTTTGRHARHDRSRHHQVPAPPPPADRPGNDRPGSDRPGSDGELRRAPTSGATLPRGPYDVSQAPAGVARLDLGSLRLPRVPAVEVRVQANPDGVIQQLVLVHGDSTLQLSALAAPRSETIWDEVREEIRGSLAADGATVEEVDGAYGVELCVRTRTPDGGQDLRFVGVSGPRWMLRAVYRGPAAVDPARAEPLAECLRGLVVDRGEEARPVREPLPLRLSDELAAQLQNQAAGVAGPDPARRGRG